MNEQRLERLASFLDRLPVKKFNFGDVVAAWETRDGKPCGAICCAIGWTPEVFPELAYWDFSSVCTPRLTRQGGDYGYVDVAVDLFEIDLDDADRLFGPSHSLPWWIDKRIGTRSPPRLVAESIRRFIVWKNPPKKVAIAAERTLHEKELILA